jgi:2-iminobutanoate/2-iminopropanoate deaminase
MSKKILEVKKAPQPIGPYSQAVEVNGMLFISGQIAIDPETGELIMDSIEVETTQVLKNLQAILLKYEMSFSNVVKSSIFLNTMDHFDKVNEVYATCFKADYPARETVAVSTLPKNVNVEISMIAVR